MAPLYSTERLKLKPTDLEDAELFFRLLNSPKWLQNIGDRNIHSVEAAAEYISEKIISQREQIGYSSFTIIRKEDQMKIGVSGLYKRDGLNLVDLGFALLQEFEGKGYAFEATRKLVDKASEDFQLEQLAAITVPTNAASRKLLEKLGFEFNKMLRLPNDEKELCYYLK